MTAAIEVLLVGFDGTGSGEEARALLSGFEDVDVGGAP